MVFRDDESTRRYIDTAICKNIQHSLSCFAFGKYFGYLRSLYEAGELTLFTRLGRFGKTLNMSMPRYFFEDGRTPEGEKTAQDAL